MSVEKQNIENQNNQIEQKEITAEDVQVKFDELKKLEKEYIKESSYLSNKDDITYQNFATIGRKIEVIESIFSTIWSKSEINNEKQDKWLTEYNVVNSIKDIENWNFNTISINSQAYNDNLSFINKEDKDFLYRSEILNHDSYLKDDLVKDVEKDPSIIGILNEKQLILLIKHDLNYILKFWPDILQNKNVVFSFIDIVLSQDINFHTNYLISSLYERLSHGILYSNYVHNKKLIDIFSFLWVDISNNIENYEDDYKTKMEYSIKDDPTNLLNVDLTKIDESDYVYLCSVALITDGSLITAIKWLSNEVFFSLFIVSIYSKNNPWYEYIESFNFSDSQIDIIVECIIGVEPNYLIYLDSNKLSKSQLHRAIINDPSIIVDLDKDMFLDDLGTYYRWSLDNLIIYLKDRKIKADDADRYIKPFLENSLYNISINDIVSHYNSTYLSKESNNLLFEILSHRLKTGDLNWELLINDISPTNIDNRLLYVCVPDRYIKLYSNYKSNVKIKWISWFLVNDSLIIDDLDSKIYWIIKKIPDSENLKYVNRILDEYIHRNDIKMPYIDYIYKLWLDKTNIKELKDAFYEKVNSGWDNYDVNIYNLYFMLWYDKEENRTDFINVLTDSISNSSGLSSFVWEDLIDDDFKSNCNDFFNVYWITSIEKEILNNSYYESIKSWNRLVIEQYINLFWDLAIKNIGEILNGLISSKSYEKILVIFEYTKVYDINFNKTEYINLILNSEYANPDDYRYFTSLLDNNIVLSDSDKKSLKDLSIWILEKWDVSLFMYISNNNPEIIWSKEDIANLIYDYFNSWKYNFAFINHF